MKKYGVQAKYISDLKTNYMRKRSEEKAQLYRLKRNFNQRGWVTDITYLRTILDLETRDWVAY